MQYIKLAEKKNVINQSVHQYQTTYIYT
jgi:hypothetical protein